MALIKEKHKVKKNNKVKPVNQPVEKAAPAKSRL
jgi:hypothetical protein